tara:strand:+ start:1166 stop:2476 length:1311 start_codon:yes stop_codon:yes gene_type:complete
MFALNQQLSEEQRLSKAVVAISRHDTYRGLTGVMQIGTKTISDDIPTACTNGRDEIYGRAFVASLTDAELRFVVLHECYHKMYRHLTTWKHLWDDYGDVVNSACDYNINGKLVDENKDDNFATMPRDADGNKIGLYDEKYREGDGWMDTPTILDDLTDGKKKKPPEPPTGEGDGPIGDGEGDGRGTGDEPTGDGRGRGEGNGWDEHDWEGANSLSDEEVKDLEKELKIAIRQGHMMAAKSGTTANRSLNELMKPQVDWREVLREFVRTVCKGGDHSTWKRPNRRYIGADIYMPSTISEKVDELVVAIDTSGSISDRAVAMFLSEVQSICMTVKPDKVRILYWGHRVVGDEVYATTELDTLVKSTKVRGGGGTDVNCVTAYMEEHKISPQATVVLTDGHLFGDWGKWDCPVLWCILDNENDVPDVGKRVVIKSSSFR